MSKDKTGCSYLDSKGISSGLDGLHRNNAGEIISIDKGIVNLCVECPYPECEIKIKDDRKRMVMV